MKIFDPNKLMETAKQLSTQYTTAGPYPHIVIDNFMSAEILDQALDSFCQQDASKFSSFNNPRERKLAYNNVASLPPKISSILYAMNQAPFLQFLETLTGIKGLIPDPYFLGGGLHQILRGGKLDVHIDFNKHKKLNLERRLNALLYLNKDWQESYGGHFELWRGKNHGGKHQLTECVNRILPIFNRFVVFSTSETSYHGHPNPLLCPDNMARRSLALYYYTVDRPEEERAEKHSTIFVPLPQNNDRANDPGYKGPKEKPLKIIKRMVGQCLNRTKSLINR